ncbi:MAG TPA: 50S ribosomal protein L18 [Ignavibacteria bacterium]|nr:50S ribosomal protein L18 [Ignavibacteria bacterium]
MKTKKIKTNRDKIKLKIRKKIKGTPERPRLVVFRSLNNIYAQLIDDTDQKTLITVSSLNKDTAEKLNAVKGKTGKSKIVGKILAEKAKTMNVETVIFDRNGYLYHGRVKAVAEGAREGGLKF